MKSKYLSIFLVLLGYGVSFSQDLPKGFTEQERATYKEYYLKQTITKGGRLQSTAPPNFSVRSIGEWEELDGVLISWRSYPDMLRNLVKEIQTEAKVYINTNRPDTVLNHLRKNNISTVNVHFIQTPLNSVWIRDFGPNSAYANDVDSLVFIDWVYNRNRPYDDAMSINIASNLNISLFQTTVEPFRMVHTGGNYMTDGLGTAFSSRLVDDENTSAAGFNVNKTPEEVDNIMKTFLGINRNIKMPNLPYDDIHHIDMHMKLLDEETLLVGQYPEGVSDGPQIEANLQYILNNFNSVFGTPYRVVRIPMPADANGKYPDANGQYFTYTNSLIINKKVLVPIYNIASDEQALQIYREAMPGYSIVGINSRSSIAASGAIHCITKEVGSKDPLLVSHQGKRGLITSAQNIPIKALIKHKSGIDKAIIIFRYNGVGNYSFTGMTAIADSAGYYKGYIPNPKSNINIEYYIKAISNSGKNIVRPLVAPEGSWKFSLQYVEPTEETEPQDIVVKEYVEEENNEEIVENDNNEVIEQEEEIINEEVENGVVSDTLNTRIEEKNLSSIDARINVFPNPSLGFVNISTKNNEKILSLEVQDIMGLNYLIKDINKESTILDLNSLNKGIYYLKIRLVGGNFMQKLILTN
jgi:agmatine/peptidylarginine deiminase